MISEKKVKRYCAEDISLIENYDKAITDQDRTWDCHHRLEVGKNGEVISYKELIAHGLYYLRPASELIFLTKSEHRRLHCENINQETRRKLSEALKGKPLSEEHKKRLSESHKGKPRSEETRKKISEYRKGKHNSEEARRKMKLSQQARRARERATN